MNILAIDIGNTRIKWGYAQAGEWLRQGWVATASPADLKPEIAAMPAPERIIVSNVAGAIVREQVTGQLP